MNSLEYTFTWDNPLSCALSPSRSASRRQSVAASPPEPLEEHDAESHLLLVLGYLGDDRRFLLRRPGRDANEIAWPTRSGLLAGRRAHHVPQHSRRRGQEHDRADGCAPPACRHTPLRRNMLVGHFTRHHEVGVHRIRDVLELLVPKVDERLVELLVHLQVDGLRHADRGGSSEHLETRRDVDSVADTLSDRRPVAHQDVAEIEADAHLQAVTLELLLGNAALNRQRGVHCCVHAGEAREDGVAGARFGVALSFGDDRPNGALQLLDRPRRALVVLTHQRAVTGNVPEENGTDMPCIRFIGHHGCCCCCAHTLRRGFVNDRQPLAKRYRLVTLSFAFDIPHPPAELWFPGVCVTCPLGKPLARTADRVSCLSDLEAPSDPTLSGP